MGRATFRAQQASRQRGALDWSAAATPGHAQTVVGRGSDAHAEHGYGPF